MMRVLHRPAGIGNNFQRHTSSLFTLLFATYFCWTLNTHMSIGLQFADERMVSYAHRYLTFRAQ